MEFNTIDTFNGKLVMAEGTDLIAQLCELLKADCVQCEILQSRIKFLEEKIALLEDIVLTSDVISSLNQTLLSNQSDQTVSHQYSEVGVQTDFQSCPNLSNQCSSYDVQFDGIHDIPKSFMLVDSNGQIEAPDSFLSSVNVGQQTCVSEDVDSSNPWGSNFYCGLKCSPVSNITGHNEYGYDNISSISSPVSSAISQYNDSPMSDSVKSIEFIDNCPFSRFSADSLVKELNFSHKFSNRSALYFGKFPYRYVGGTHEPKDLPGGSHLDKLCCYLGVILPNFEYNSVLINMYENGEDFMPSHSDSESCIEDTSDIVTVSLGAAREMKITDSTGKAVQSALLQHGSLSIMSKASQTYFRHEIPPNPECTELRVSITFRLIKPDIPNRKINQVDYNQHSTDPYSKDSNASGYVPYPKDTRSQIQHAPQSYTQIACNELPSSQLVPSDHDATSVLFISSSMFRFLDEYKLSSPAIKAKKLFYPGADAVVMLQKLKSDLPMLHIKPSTIYLMCGTNNVNSIYYGSRSLDEAATDISEVVKYLKLMFPSVKIHLINILPRVSKGRNDIVVELNKLLKNFCHRNTLDFMETNYLFNLRNGNRKNMFFIAPNDKVKDNCHLNPIGVKRLGRYLKYWAHRHLN